MRQNHPKPADLESFIAGMAPWAKIGMSQEDFYRMPPAWRLAQVRAMGAPPTHSRRPVLRSLSAAEMALLEGLSRTEYHTRARQMQQTPLPQQP